MLRSVAPDNETGLKKASALLLAFLEGYALTRGSLPIRPAELAEDVSGFVLGGLDKN